MSYSQKLAQLYDSLMEGYEFILNPTQRLVYEFTEKKKNVTLLELGCGTGTVLKIFPKEFTLYGLDISPYMLSLAKKKVKQATYIEADMSNFSISKKFDVIICVFDSLNHLTEFAKWEQTFQRVNQHLKKDGIFIFDMNTVKRHKSLVDLPAYIKKEANRLVAFKILQKSKNVYIDRIQIFDNLSGSTISLSEESIPEASFPTKKVIKSLQKYFTIEKMLDAHRDSVTKDSGRIFFACKKMNKIKKQSPLRGQ